MKKALLFMAGVAVAATAAFAEPAEKLYGIGEPFGGWGGNVGLELEKVSDGVFKYEGELSGYFAFTSQLGADANDWATLNAHRYGPTVKDALLKDGVNEMAYGQDASWNSLAGTYTLTIDTNTMTLTVGGEGGGEKVTTYALHGQFDGLTNDDWKSYPLTQNPDNDKEWVAEFAPAVSGGNFGVKQEINGAQTDWYSAGVTFDADNTTFALTGEPAGNCTFDYPASADNTYKFIFTPEDVTLKIVPAGEGAIAGVEADSNVAAKYFNLQGVQVANPENGLYIVVKGNKVSKVVM